MHDEISEANPFVMIKMLQSLIKETLKSYSF